MGQAANVLLSTYKNHILGSLSRAVPPTSFRDPLPSDLHPVSASSSSTDFSPYSSTSDAFSPLKGKSDSMSVRGHARDSAVSGAGGSAAAALVVTGPESLQTLVVSVS